MRELSQADARGDVCEIEFSSDELDLHAVGGRPNHSLQAVLFRQLRLAHIVQHQAAAFAGRDVLVGVETERDQVSDRADALSAPL